MSGPVATALAAEVIVVIVILMSAALLTNAGRIGMAIAEYF